MCCLPKNFLKHKDTKSLTVKEKKNIYQANTNQMKALGEV